MYNPKSMKAEDFINHNEIMKTLAYADAHKHDRELIEQILEKAAQYKGLTHREASVRTEVQLCISHGSDGQSDGGRH